jgi:hypothetical protein
MLRKLLVGSAHYILAPFGSDSDLRRHAEKIASRAVPRTPRSERWWPWRGSSRYSCTACGLVGRSTTRSTTPTAEHTSRGRRLKRGDGGAVSSTEEEEVRTTGTQHPRR